MRLELRPAVGMRREIGAVRHAVQDDEHLVDELRRLTEARRDARIGQAEYERRKQALIARIA